MSAPTAPGLPMAGPLPAGASAEPEALPDSDLTARIAELEREAADAYQRSILATRQADRLREVRTRRLMARIEAFAAAADWRHTPPPDRPAARVVDPAGLLLDHPRHFQGADTSAADGRVRPGHIARPRGTN